MLSLFALAAVAATPRSNPWPFVPLRVESRLITRPGLTSTVIFEGGFQAFRVRYLTAELNLGVTPTARFRDSEIPRTIGTVSASADVLLEPTAFLAIGPSASVDLRWYRQQYDDVALGLMPTAGLRVNCDVLRGRWYALAITLKGMTDLGRTLLVYDDAPPRALSILSGQAGLRFDFGHGKNLGRRRS